MSWELTEAVEYYRRQGAPGDQTALRSFLAEMQAESGGAIPAWLLAQAAQMLGVKETFLTAIVRRIPSLRVKDQHLLEICAGSNCSRRGDLAGIAEQYRGKAEIRFVPCMRWCGKGPNIRFDGMLHNAADARLLARLLDGLDQ